MNSIVKRSSDISFSDLPVGSWLGTVASSLSSDVCEFSDDHWHHADSVMDSHSRDDGTFDIKCRCKNCNQVFTASGITSEQLSTAYNAYVTDNNLTVVGGGDNLTLQLASTSMSTADLDKAVTNGILKWWSLKNNTFSIKLGSTGEFKFPSSVYSNEFKVVQNGKYTVSAFTLIAPSVAPLYSSGYHLQKCVDGKWLNVFSYSSSGTYFENDYGLYSIRYQIGSTSLSFQSEYRYRFCFGLSPTSMYCGGGQYAGTEHSLVFPSISLTSSSGGSTQAPATSRIGSAMQAINNYNTTNNTVNYYIGTSDANGKITNVYSPDLFNESTLKFTEPVTGTQYVCSNWNYAYTPSARGYYLDLAAGTYSYNGMDIRSIVLAYLDDALYIIGSDQELDDYTVDTYLADAVFVDKYDYVIATAKDDSPSGTTCNHVYTSSTTTAPTCTEQGVRRYTCTLCGHTRDEKVPATGHSWAVTETVETETAENGDVTRAGYTLYTCSACGETYKQWSDTGQPGPPGGSGSGGSSGDSFWTKIKNAFSNALASLIESVLSFITDVLDKLLGTVKDLLSFFFDLLNSTVIAGISGFFSGFKDSRLFSFFKKDGSDAMALPEGVAAVFAFFSGVIMALPVELRSLLLFGTAFLLMIGVLRILKS